MARAPKLPQIDAEQRLALEASEGLEGREERLLDHVARVLLGADDAPGHGQQARRGAAARCAKERTHALAGHLLEAVGRALQLFAIGGVRQIKALAGARPGRGAHAKTGRPVGLPDHVVPGVRAKVMALRGQVFPPAGPVIIEGMALRAGAHRLSALVGQEEGGTHLVARQHLGLGEAAVGNGFEGDQRLVGHF